MIAFVNIKIKYMFISGNLGRSSKKQSDYVKVQFALIIKNDTFASEFDVVIKEIKILQPIRKLNVKFIMKSFDIYIYITRFETLFLNARNKIINNK